MCSESLELTILDPALVQFHKYRSMYVPCILVL